MASSEAAVPAPPAPALGEFGRALVAGAQFADVEAHYAAENAKWKLAGDFARELHEPVRRALHLCKYGALDEAAASLAAARAALAALPAADAATLLAPRPHRPHRVAEELEQLARAEHALAFFSRGRVASLAALRAGAGGAAPGVPLDDDEWLGGLLAMVGDLSPYATRRATLGDVRSVRIAKGLADSLQAKLLQFDFRNGPNRRKFDGLKYTVKRLEDLLYEQSLVSAAAGGAGGGAGADADGDARMGDGADGGASDGAAGGGGADGDPALAELDGVRARMEAYDEARELVIKGTRDTQKLAKLAVYSLHRGEGAKATKQLADALAAAEKLRPKLDEYPALRPGSYSNAMEEWAEAALFARWLDARAVPARAALGVADLEVDECVARRARAGLAALSRSLLRIRTLRSRMIFPRLD